MNLPSPTFSRRGFVAAGCVAGVINAATAPAPAPAAASPPARKRISDHDVRDYDAIGDGRADDTEAIRSAIAAASSSGGATVLFPPGVYNVASTLEIPSNLTLKGHGRSSTIHGSTANMNILSLSNCRGAVIEGLRFTGTGKLGTAGRAAVWLSPHNGEGPRECKILNNWFEGLGTCGIVLGFASGCVVTGNHIDGTAEHGIYISSTTDCIVANNVVRDAGQRGGVSTVVGIKVARTNGLVLSGNVVESALTEGILIESGTSRCTVVANLVRQAGQRAIRVNDKTSSIQISGNMLFESGTETIRVFGGTSCNINGNTIESTKDSAITIDSASRGVSVANNSITGISTDAWTIRLDGAGHVLMGNVINACKFGVKLASSARDIRLLFNQITATDRPLSEFDSKMVKVVD